MGDRRAGVADEGFDGLKDAGAVLRAGGSVEPVGNVLDVLE